METPLRILHLEDDPDYSDLVRTLLTNDGLRVEMVLANNHAEFNAALLEGGFDLIIADYRLPGSSGLQALQTARQLCPDVPFLLVSGTIGEQAAIESLKAGATDYVLKQWPDRLVPAVRRAVQEARERARRKRAEWDLIRREGDFRTLMENSLDVLSILNRDCVSQYHSPSLKHVLGYEPIELIGRNAAALVHPDDLPAAKQAFEDLIQHPEKRVTQEIRCRRRDGTWLDLEVICQNRLKDPGIGGVVLNSRDITNRKQAEAHLRLQSAALESAANAILITDRSGIAIWANPAFTRLTGYSTQEIVGQNLRVLRSGEHDQLFYRKMWDTILAGRVWQGEMVNCRKDGSRYTEHCAITPVRSERGEITHFIAVKQDITAQKELASQLRQAQKMEIIGQLAGGIAHDLNNILAPILMATGMLREKSSDPEDQRTLAMLETSARRGADIVRQLLWFGRGLQGQRVLLNPKYLMNDVARFVSETFDKSIQLERNLPANLWAIKADPTHLHQVLLNLCLNSRDAMPFGGRLGIAARNFTVDQDYAAQHPEASPGPYVILEIKDTGQGISPEIRQKIFEPFFTTKPPGKGTGLGLWSVASIVKDYGGLLELDTEVGKGTTFRVYLPAEPESRAEEPSAERQSPPRGHGETVLVIDDEEAVRKVVQKTLENFGYRVLIAGDGEKAVATYVENRAAIAVVLTDLMMPVMDGAATIRALQSINPQVKVIAGSGLGRHPRRDSLIGLGVKHFVTKPYTAETILLKLQEVLAEDPGWTP